MTEPSAIAQQLDNVEPEARRLAAMQIPQVRGPGAARLLLRALGDTDWRVRKEASAVAGSIVRREELIRELVAALDEKVNIGLRNAAVEALIAIGTDAVPATVRALATLDADGRKLAVEALGGIPDLRATFALAGALSDADPNVRSTSAEALKGAVMAGDEARQHAITALTAALSSQETLLKLAALDSLTKLEAELPWATFEPLLADSVLRQYAISAAVQAQEPGALRALVRAIEDPSPSLARSAVIGLGERLSQETDADWVVNEVAEALRGAKLAPARLRAMAGDRAETRLVGHALVVLSLVRDPRDLPIFVRALDDEEIADRAERGLRLFGEVAVAPLMALLEQRDGAPPVRARILELVPLLVSSATPALLSALRRLLSDPSADVITAALRVLAAIGQAADLEHVAPFFAHTDPRVTSTATSALHTLSEQHLTAARALVSSIDSAAANAAVGCVILNALAGLGQARPSDVVFLQGALGHGDVRARRAAVDALANIGGDEAADAVRFALADEEQEVVLSAIRSLGRLGRSEPLEALLGGSREPRLVSPILRALADADPDRAFEAALPLVRGGDTAMAFAAVDAIGRVEGARREDGLFAALDHPEPEVVMLALSELGRSLDARALARLGMCLDHPSWEVRKFVAELLGQERSASAKALLRARLEREKEVVVREAVTAALSLRPPASSGGGGS